ncbi:MAG TPA: hypothetical protein VN837_10700 [Chloroflexota bacterium]|nr:hypothetical protein [Chloroflexota bacterium]
MAFWPESYKYYYLRAHSLATAYAQAKPALARHDPNDWDLYYHVKDPIRDIILAGAADWADGARQRAYTPL